MTNEWSGDGLNRRYAASTIAQMKSPPIEPGVIADSGAIKFHEPAQREMTILVEHIDNLNAISRQSCGDTGGFSAIILTRIPCFLLFLRNEHDCIANGVCCTSMSGSRVSNEE